ncbi:hypothetical protein ACRALDRAFT_208225 [Sodiomyces alcalophilus JCM 7366]|uniref:uncharacterized protein n=1 Tax=Sodiomyces alcalophilus JCM 7366 TaxID=591952 RepID=UPI0039B4FF4C
MLLLYSFLGMFVMVLSPKRTYHYDGVAAGEKLFLGPSYQNMGSFLAWEERLATSSLTAGFLFLSFFSCVSFSRLKWDIPWIRGAGLGKRHANSIHVRGTYLSISDSWTSTDTASLESNEKRQNYQGTEPTEHSKLHRDMIGMISVSACLQAPHSQTSVAENPSDPFMGCDTESSRVPGGEGTRLASSNILSSPAITEPTTLRVYGMNITVGIHFPVFYYDSSCCGTYRSGSQSGRLYVPRVRQGSDKVRQSGKVNYLTRGAWLELTHPEEFGRSANRCEEEVIVVALVPLHFYTCFRCYPGKVDDTGHDD